MNDINISIGLNANVCIFFFILQTEIMMMNKLFKFHELNVVINIKIFNLFLKIF